MMEIREFLTVNGVTHEDMQNMWDSLYETNWIVKNLTDSGKNWTDMNTRALKSLIEQYEKFQSPPYGAE